MTLPNWRSLTRTERIASPGAVARAFVIVVCASVIGLTAWRVHLARDIALAEGRTGGANLARSVADHTHATVEAADIVLAGMVERLQTDGMSDAALRRMHRLLVMRVTGTPRITSLVVFGADGTWLVSSHADDTIGQVHGSFADRDYISFHRDHPGTTLHVGVPIQSVADGRWNFTLSRRFEAPDGGFGGVVVATIDLDLFAAFFASFDAGPVGAIALMNDDGTMLVRSPPAPDSIGKGFSASAFFLAYRAHGPVGLETGVSPVDGVNRIRAFHKVEGYPLVVFGALSEDDVLAAWRRDTLIALLATAAVSLALGTFGWRLAKQIKLRHEAELAVRSRERQYRLLADNSSDLIVQLDRGFRRVYVSPSSQTLIGYEPHELIGHSPIDLANPEDRPALLDCFATLAVAGQAPPVTYRIRHKNGSETWVELNGRKLGEMDGFVITIRDVARRKQAEDALHEANNQLQRTVMLDGLTGIANRRCFDAMLEREFRRAARSEFPLALLMLDVDHFKSFNDTYGHPEGDACLRAIADAVAQTIRRPGDVAARYGGEEFAALLPETDEAGARAMAERIRLAVRRLAIAHRGGVQGTASVSVGVAVIWPRAGGESAADLVRMADAALYRAKSAGRDRVFVSGASDAAATMAA